MPWLYRIYNYGPIPQLDIKYNFEATAIYDLPFGKGKHWLSTGKAANILGGWQLSGLFSDFTGRPFSVVANNNLNAVSSYQFANCNGTPQQVGSAFGMVQPGHLLCAVGYRLRKLRHGRLEGPRVDQRGSRPGKEIRHPGTI